MQVTLKSLLIALVVIAILLFATGVIQWQKPAYGCYPDDTNKFTWREKVEVFKWGSLRVYAYPLIKDCPQENRYDPKKAIDIGRIEE